MLFACKLNESKSPHSNYSDASTGTDKLLNKPHEFVDENSISQSVGKSEVNQAQVEPSMIMKDGNIIIEVEDLKIAKHSIDSIIIHHVGYYEREVFKNSRYDQNYDLKIRMPTAHFEAVLKALETDIGIVQNKQINAKDITEEYLDLEIRLDNNKAYLDRYKKLLNKANTINEMIVIQEKIRQIEKQVDSNMGKMKYLSNRVEYSTLSLKLTLTPEEVAAVAPPTFIDDIAEVNS